MKKYYYISYWCKKICNDWSTINGEVIDKHPLKWMLDCYNEYRDVEKYTIISWQEITKEEFDAYDGQW